MKKSQFKVKYSGLGEEIKALLKSGKTRKEVYAMFDAFNNRYGIEKKSFKAKVREFDNRLKRDSKSMSIEPDTLKTGCSGDCNCNLEELPTIEDLNRNKFTSYTNDDLLAAVVKAMEVLRIPQKSRNKVNLDHHGKVAILHITDPHLMATVSFRGELSKLNVYNKDIALKRTTFCFDEFKQFLKVNNIKNAIIYISGDLYEGLIHEEGKYGVDESIMDVIIEFATMLSVEIQAVAKIANVKVINVSGNHSRLAKKFEIKMFASNNFDYLTGKILKVMNPNIEVFVCPEFFHREEINGIGYLLTHGNMFKGGKNMAGNPTSSISRDVTNLVSKVYSEIGITNIKYMLIGHFHCNFNIAGMAVRVIGGGSMIGHNDFSVANSFGSPASQNIYTVDNCGRLDMVKEIFCGHIKE